VRFTLARTRELVRAFGLEQSDPDAFYRPLAADSVALAARWLELDGATVLDVGGGPGYFQEAFEAAGARYVSCEPAAEGAASRHVAGDGQALPFRDGVFDLCFSSNVLEHVPRPEDMCREMIRVTVPEGVLFLSFTNWLGPLGGHETSPWHYLGGEYAARRYQRHHGAPPKNRFGGSLFRLSITRVLRCLRATDGVRLLSVFPRYHPWWLHWVVRVPGLREVATANCVVVLRRGPVPRG
jgi:SAM-dependent methyltransferase